MTPAPPGTTAATAPEQPQDHWDVEQDGITWHRIHVVPRQALYISSDDGQAPHEHFQDLRRTTILRPGQPQRNRKVLQNDWRLPDASRSIPSHGPEQPPSSSAPMAEHHQAKMLYLWNNNQRRQQEQKNMATTLSLPLAAKPLASCHRLCHQVIHQQQHQLNMQDDHQATQENQSHHQVSWEMQQMTNKSQSQSTSKQCTTHRNDRNPSENEGADMTSRKPCHSTHPPTTG